MLTYGKCSLEDLINIGRQYNEDEVLSIMLPLAEAMHEMHSKLGICHRDIKP